jgi:phosphoribosylformylglycinamidine (FGAM) synthase-like enzyme
MFGFLAVELALPREERMTPADLVKMVRESQERLAQTSPSLPPFLLELFRKEFEI